MEGIDALLQYGPLGVFAAYMLRKESLWEAEKKAQTEKYNNILINQAARHIGEGQYDLTLDAPVVIFQ